MTPIAQDYDLRDLEEDLEHDPEEAFESDDLGELDELSQEFVDKLVVRSIIFGEELTGVKLLPYQKPFAIRLIESIIVGDGEEITALWARQSGKTETVSFAVVTMMVLLPKLAKIFPDLLGKFEDGFWVGIFAPVDEQAETLHSRIVTRLTSDRAVDIMLDPEIDDAPNGGGSMISLSKSGSFCRRQTANPRAKIESKSYHLVIIDEAQDADDRVVRKSIHPMLAFYNGTIVKIGTPTTHKGDFYRSIQQNKRRATRHGAKDNHFEASWRECAKYNKNYAKFIKKEIIRLGEDSDEFQMSYNLKWLLDRGMFTTAGKLDALGDVSMQIVRSYYKTPCVVGIDPARDIDSTVVTVLWVDWRYPDQMGYYDCRILNWLEIHGTEWEEQYFQITDFLDNYHIWKVAVDSQGMGGPVAERLQVLMPHVEVASVPSDQSTQSKRWKHLTQMLDRGRIGWPAHSKARRLKTWKRFRQQMEDLEKIYKGPYMMAEAPDEAGAHDDYPDSLALAAILTKDDELAMPEVEVTENPFVGSRRH